MRHQIGDRLGDRYELRAPIAVGGMGEVWRALDTVLGRDVAVKVLKPEYSADPGFLERFRAEARHTAALSHPNIAAVYDYGEASDGGQVSAYLVMELVPGEPLSDELSRQGRMPADRAMDLLGQAAQGLAAAHAAGFVHRDVKPGNLLVTPEGHVKVTDFGIARAVDQVPLTATGQVMGTAQYLAPEQALGRGATPASDVYALGVVAFEAVAGSRPFGGETPVAQAMAHVNDAPPSLPADVPAPVRALIEQAMSKTASERPADGAAFAAAAARARAGQMPFAAGAATAATAAAAGGATAATQAMSDGRTAVMPVSGAAASGAGTRVLPVAGAGAAGLGAAGAGATDLGARGPLGAGPRRRRRVSGPLLALLALLVFILAGAVTASLLDGDETSPSTTPSASEETRSGASQTQPSTTSSPTESTSTTTAPTTTSSPPPTSTQPPGIEVVAADYLGRELREVRRDLERLGLKVDAVPAEESDEPKNRVTAVEEGTYVKGDTVRVEYSEGKRPGDDEGGDD